MPALVTSPPIIIDPIGFSRQFGLELNQFGFFQNGNDLYLVLYPDKGTTIGVWKNTIAGISGAWTEMDAAHHPTSIAAAQSCCYDPVGQIIYILYWATGNNLIIQQFNIATGLYGSAGASLSIGFGNANGSIYVQSSGVLVVVYTDTSGGHSGMYFRTYSAGVWSGETTLVSAPGMSGVTTQVDSADAGHITISDNSSNFVYYRLSSTFVLSSPTTLGVTDNTRQDVKIWNSNIVWTWTSGQVLNVAIGTPLSAPVFTQFSVATVTGSASVSYGTLAINLSGNLVVFWVVLDFSGTPYIDRLLMSTFDGIATWGAPVLVYDEIANPPANSVVDQTQQLIHTGEAFQLPDGRWVFTTALETIVASVTHCTGFILLPNASPVVGTCPITINAGPSGGGPCLNPGTNPTLDSYLELRKVLVAWKKETHLPIRGKS